jgi:hypothetical protein
MSITTSQPTTIEEFLELPETKPASEYIDKEKTRRCQLVAPS